MRLVHFIGVLRRYQDKLSGYMIALIVLILALGVRELLDPYIKIPYVTLFPAMIVCSLVGGRLAGILAAAVGGIVAWYLWLPPRGSFSEWPTAHLTILLYVLTSTILLLLTRGLNETLKELEKERDLSAELFRELQHRTANNLQNVSALLRQNREAIRRDPSMAVAVIYSAERRFKIMSRINRRLYAHPWRLDLDWRWHRAALGFGCMMSINPDAHSIRELDHMHWGVEMARKGGVPAARVLNAMTLSQMTQFLKRRRLKYAGAA
jgi:K+-sensing histidine kinase KdpD